MALAGTTCLTVWDAVDGGDRLVAASNAHVESALDELLVGDRSGRAGQLRVHSVESALESLDRLGHLLV